MGGTGIHFKIEVKKMSGWRNYLGSALADDNGTGLGDLITKDFDAKPLAFRIAAILGASSSFLVCTLDG